MGQSPPAAGKSIVPPANSAASHLVNLLHDRQAETARLRKQEDALRSDGEALRRERSEALKELDALLGRTWFAERVVAGYIEGTGGAAGSNGIALRNGAAYPPVQNGKDGNNFAKVCIPSPVTVGASMEVSLPGAVPESEQIPRSVSLPAAQPHEPISPASPNRSPKVSGLASRRKMNLSCPVPLKSAAAESFGLWHCTLDPVIQS
eukprot:gnl/TRDRNA2_/TRDRNA2_173460_c3_seq1.p1 gnl/TRDRNA2_/TRDRNA2_173460_c3~~gnl/TRDRNA2_/TRDRNA2_173460_c3_seq1.p1  ORF type:complete len:206 (-),score=29.52 gnl/TRDRNA2_/TRDRNA2_173460_c3_seq1:36-653(-)